MKQKGSLLRLQIELSLKASLLELERIFVVLRAELLSGSTLTDELLPLVETVAAALDSELKRLRAMQSLKSM